MTIRKKTARLVVTANFAVAVFAQTPVTAVRAPVLAGFIGGFPTAPLAGHPYSAEQTTEHTQVLADGTRISQNTQTSLMYRDSEGRTRTERSFPLPPGGSVGTARHTFIEIYDPVAGCRYILNDQNHSGQKIPFPPAMHTGSNGQASAWFSTSSVGSAPQVFSKPLRMAATAPVGTGMMGSLPAPPAATDVKQESLGTETIEGVQAEGRRTTTTYPEGWFGNDRPLTTTFETWTASDIQGPVLIKISDPRTGENITRLINVRLTEPDAALFQVPPDYKISEPQLQSSPR